MADCSVSGDEQINGGGGGDGGFSLNLSLSTSQQGSDLGISIGGDGGAAGNGSTLDITNTARIVTLSDRSQGIQAQSIGGGGGNGGGVHCAAQPAPRWKKHAPAASR